MQVRGSSFPFLLAIGVLAKLCLDFFHLGGELLEFDFRLAVFALQLRFQRGDVVRLEVGDIGLEVGGLAADALQIDGEGSIAGADEAAQLGIERIGKTIQSASLKEVLDGAEVVLQRALES